MTNASPTKSPSKHRTLSRQSSSTSLNVGLPPPLPESIIMQPSMSSRSLKRVRSRTRLHRGDVESSATSGDEGNERDDEDHGDPFIVPASMARVSASVDLTPRRKIAGSSSSNGLPLVPPIPATVGRGGQKRETLQERLANAARVKKSRSFGDGLPTSGSAEDVSLLAATERLREDGRSGSSKDKVVVCVRIKPTSSSFISTAYELSPHSLILADGHPSIVKRGGSKGREAENTYTFDMLLQHPSRTPDLYAAKVAPLVDKAMRGFNSTIFAYGQTGSGKSFTMTGNPAELGVIPCAVDGVFDAITADRDRAFLLRVSYIEIYNETLRDLLDFKKEPKDIPAIHTNKGKVYVSPLTEEIVSTPQDVMKLLSKGNEGRKVGATDWNDRSSRSHCVFTIVIESRPRDADGNEDIRLSRLSLIDLAGSEKAVSDLERRGEGKHINQSLLALREVINKLTEKKRSHIPYRNSKLTHLLENALGGDSNICVICTISAEEEHASETLETMKFAGRCSQVETKAKKNVLPSSEKALIRAKDAEIEELKNRLQSLASHRRGSNASSSAQSDHMSELADSVADLESRKSRLVAQLAKLNGEILTSELPRMNGFAPLSPPRQKRRRISEFLGAGRPKAIGPDRRAVSGLVRVSEEDVDDESMDFTEDQSVASLRKALCNRDVELDRLRAELSTLRAQSSSSQTRLLDSVHETETTRSSLVSVVAEKAARIDELEETVLDLRKSREDLLIEDQLRIDQLQRKLDTALMDLERSKRVATGDMPSDLELEQEAHRLDLDQVNKSHAIETARLGADVKRLAAQLRDRWAVAEAAISQRKELERRNLELQAEVDHCREAVDRYDTVEREVHRLGEALSEATEKAVRGGFLEASNTALKAELAKMEHQVAGMTGLEKQLAELQEENRSLRSKEGLAADLESERDRIRAEQIDAVAKVAAVEVIAQELREEVGRKEQDLSAARVESERLQTALTTAEATAAEHKQKLGHIEVDLQDRTRELENARGMLEAARNAGAETDSQLRLEKESIEARLADVQKAAADQETQLAEVQRRAAELETRLAGSQRAAIDQEAVLGQVRSEAETRIGELQQSLSDLERNSADSLGRLRTEKNDLEGQLAAVQGTSAESLDAMRHQLAEMTTQKEQALAAVSELQVKMGATDDELRKQTAELQDRLNQMNQETDALRTAATEAAHRVENAAALQERVDQLTGEVEALRAASTDSEQRLALAANLQARIDQMTGEITTLRASSEEMKQRLKDSSALQGRFDQLNGEMDTLRAAAAETEQRLKLEVEEAVRERQKADSGLEEFQRKATANESETIAALRRDISGKVEELSKVEADREALRAEIKALETTSAEQLAKEVEAKTAALRAAEEAKVLSQKADKERAELEVALDSERKRATDLQSSRDTTAAALDASEEGARQMISAIQEKDGRILELQTSHDTLTRTLADLRDSAGGKEDVVKQLHVDLDDIRQKFEATRKERGELQSQLKAAKEEAAQRVSEHGEALQGQIEARSTAEKQLKETEAAATNANEDLRKAQAEISQLQAAISKSSAALQELRDRLQTTEESMKAATEETAKSKEQLAKAINGQSDSTRRLQLDLDKALAATRAITASRDKAQSDLLSSEADLAASRKRLAEAESQLEASRSASHDHDAKTVQLRVEIDDLTRQLENRASVVTAFSRQLEESKTARAALEKRAQGLAGVQADKEAALFRCDALRGEVKDTQLKLSAASVELAGAKARIESLGRELTEARKSSTSTSLRSMNRLGGGTLPKLPTIVSSGSLADIASRGNPDGRSGWDASATEEVERLEKVIEAQQIVIDDQREKIKFWSNELEKQREVVRLLTSAPDGSSSISTSPMGTRHIKSQSVGVGGGHSSGRFSPTASPVIGMPKKSLTSTFTARNLALPSAPTPLPMHSAQYANTSARATRKGRTSKGLDGIAESKVYQTKAIFEGSDPDVSRRTVGEDVPRQRRR